MKFKTFLWIAIPLLLLAIGFILWPKIKTLAKSAVPGTGDGGTGGNTGSTGTGSTKTGVGQTNTKTTLNYNLQLCNGSRGAEVKELQQMLNTVRALVPASKNLQPLVADGIFGAKTLAMLRAVAGVSCITLNGALSRITSYTG